MYNSIVKSVPLTLRVIPLQPPEMGVPLLALFPLQFWICQHQFDVAEVFRERGSRQAAYVLDQDRLGLEFLNRGDHLRKHVSFICMTAMFAANRKWLTRNASRQKV